MFVTENHMFAKAFWPSYVLATHLDDCQNEAETGFVTTEIQITWQGTSYNGLNDNRGILQDQGQLYLTKNCIRICL